MQKSRLFEIVYILLENKAVTAAELAERFEVSVRTIYRDVEALSESGVPIYMSRGKGGGISLMPDYVLNKAVLSEQEKTDILSAVKALTALDPSGSSSAMDKLGSMLGSGNSNWIEVDFTSWGSFKNEAEYFNVLKNAIIRKRTAEFLYSSGKAETTKRKVYPLKLVFKGSSWYLYGYCTLRKDFRFFKIRRISELAVTDEGFNMNPPERLFEDYRDIYVSKIKVVFRIKKQMAFRVYDEFSEYETEENGDFLCTLYLPDVETICSYASSFGKYCKIICPPQAASRMKNELEEALKNYL